MYWQVGRKNAKSQSLACVASYELMAYSKGRTEVFCGATKTEQAEIVWNETKAALEGCELLKGKFSVKYSKIIHNKTDSVFRALSEEDRKTGDGLNVQCGIIDEYHAHDTSEILDILTTGGGARAEPFIPIITTAGLDLRYPCYRVEYSLCSKILNPDIGFTIDSYFVMINELDRNETPDTITVNGKDIPAGELIDDITDERNWLKSNPIQCSYPEGVDFIREELKGALAEPEKMTNFLTKLMNVWVNQREVGYMDMAKWSACGTSEARPLPDIVGKKCYPGVDLSAIHDLTSADFEIPLPDNEYVILSHSFIPRDTLEKKIKTDKMPYDLWVREGWITAIPGPVVDYQVVLDYIEEQFEKYGWKKDELCYDRAMATWFAGEVEKLDFKAVDIPQSYTGISESTKDLKAKIYQRKIYHDNNPVLSWAMSNSVCRKGPSGNIMLDKERSTDRIDPVAAAVNSHARAMVGSVDEFVYNSRGMRSLA
jgi:phage terminase large subunit-like protein